MKSSSLTILSTYTDDVLLDQHGVVLGTQDGGPARYIADALQDEQLPYSCKTGARLTVEILLTPDGEFGKITAVPETRNLPAELSNWTILSTVLNEWDIVASRNNLPAYLCMDVQGYVRDGRHFGQKHTWSTIETIADKVFCLKGTAEEISLLPASVVESQKQRLLLVTNGKAGIEIYHEGRHAHITVTAVNDLKDTIGAGDSFFAYFVAALFKGLSPESAARTAADKTTLFLRRKNELVSA